MFVRLRTTGLEAGVSHRIRELRTSSILSQSTHSRCSVFNFPSIVLMDIKKPEQAKENVVKEKPGSNIILRLVEREQRRLPGEMLWGCETSKTKR